MKSKKRSFDLILVILTIIIMLFFISGQSGCSMPGNFNVPGFPGFGGGGSQGAKTGLDFSLISGVDYLSTGKVIQQQETFYVGVRVENYDQKKRDGLVCIRDNVADSFGGVSSGNAECKNFAVKSAEIVSEKSGFFGKTQAINPGTTEIYFPDQQGYNYYGLPSLLKPYQGVLYVSLRYRQTSKITGTVNVPVYDNVVLSQEPAPLTVTVSKSIHRYGDSYQVDLRIIFKKSFANIYSSDFSKGNVTYFNINMIPANVKCTTINNEPLTNFLEFDTNEKIIKCSALVYSTQEASYPLVITLDYGVELEKSFAFAIDTSLGEKAQSKSKIA